MYMVDLISISIISYVMHAYMLMIMYDHILLPSLLLISMLPHDIYMRSICRFFNIVSEMFVRIIRIYGLVMNLISFELHSLLTFMYIYPPNTFKYIITVIFNTHFINTIYTCTYTCTYTGTCTG